MEINLCTLAKHFSDEDAAWLLVEELRWPNGPICPHCGSVDDAKFLAARNGYVAAYELHRTLGVTQRTAWHLTHRIREAMKAGPMADMFRGTVVADETFIGGKPKNRHQQDPKGAGRTHKRVGPTANKVPVLSLVNRETGEVRSRVVADVTGHTLRKVIAEQVDFGGSRLLTDAGLQYKALGDKFASHQFVDHSAKEYVRGDVSTNAAEGYFSQLKRSLDGTHHHVSTEHLPRYLAEFDFRYSTRKASDSERMTALMGQVHGKRLTYKGLKAGVAAPKPYTPSCLDDVG